jgi:tetratricopeptide (TPR) repeat protein
MTQDSAATRAADTLRDKAGRLRSAARGKANATEMLRQADALHAVAEHVGAGLEALRAALGPVGTAHGDVSVADRERAGTEVYGLAQRRAEKGTQRQIDAAGKSGWERSADGLPIHRATLREAARIYELALALHYDSYWDYSRGLLHESLGEYADAIAIFENLSGHYVKYGAEQAERCRRRLAGNYDAQAELDALLPTSQPDAVPLSDAGVERAERTAQTFAELLAHGDYAAAQALLARDLRDTGADALRTQYEQMMSLDEGEDHGETTVMVMIGSADMPDLGPDDVGWVYVAITNAMRNEAVTVVVTVENGEARIRELEWGRP